jgi:hypothetical protein
MLGIQDLYERGISSGLISVSFAEPTYQTITTTSTLPWGDPASIFTQTLGTTVLVVHALTDTVVLTTFLRTTTIPSGQSPFTSTFTDPKSAAITEVIGTTGTGIATTSPTSSSSSLNSTFMESFTSSGLATAGKVGIGVAIPLLCILLALGVLWYLQRRKKTRPISSLEPEKDDGGLPEPTTTLQELAEPGSREKIGPRGDIQVEAGGTPIHEIHSSQRITKHELSANLADNPSELYDTPSGAHHELTASHVQPPRSLSPAFPPASSPIAVPRKPVAPAERSPPSFPRSWENPASSEVKPPQQVALDEGNEAAELARLEEEVARVKLKRQRLQQLQALEAQEEELERSIQEKKKGGSSRH